MTKININNKSQPLSNFYKLGENRVKPFERGME